ncbi:type VII secretion target [Nocardia neocaledoniensis]|uniref:type VII secretion target n=1 Tax=Nocardia neocaledoniensis TaxID=236511 RepID=UPI002458F151|nr:type VII secretion target [Nocardia neocaledoniensis]
MSDMLNIDTNTVRAQGAKLQSTAQELTAVANSWVNMFDKNDLGTEYAAEAAAIVTGFEHTATAVKNWSGACTAFGDALTNSANSVQYTDDQFSSAIGKVSVDGNGDLTVGGK